jgi:diaphanous 1
LKELQRQAMHQLPADRKSYLLGQHKQSRVAFSKPHSHVTQPSHSATYGPSSAGNLLPRLVPQLTGDSGLMKRLSMPGWGAASATSSTPPPSSNRNGERPDPSWMSGQAQNAKAMEESQPLQPQTTGGLWSSWWVSSGGEKSTQSKDQPKEGKTPKWYVDSIKGKALDTKLVKHLISLRVHLSTARVFWVKEFVETEAGFDALSTILAGLVGRAGKRKHLTDMEDAVLLETMKVLRVLSNTEVS